MFKRLKKTGQNDPHLIGHIDSALLTRAITGEWELQLEGWILHPFKLNQAITVTPVGRETNGRPTEMHLIIRPDVALRLPHLDHAKSSGFKGVLKIGPEQAKILTLKFDVTLDDRTQVTSCLKVEPQTKLVPSPGQVGEYGSNRAREHLNTLARIQFNRFLKTNRLLNFHASLSPKLSIMIVTYNQAALTFSCLESVKREWQCGEFELIIVDNGSTDDSTELFSRLEGATVIRNQANTHFLKAANQAAKHAKGESLLFLNSDTVVTAGSIDEAMTLLSNDDIGVVGAKLVRPDGQIQEAGAMVFGDGTTASWGRGQPINDPKYDGIRDVDYVSGAFLMTKRALFEAIGGFDPLFAPAYYEDVDYCFQVRARGKRVVCTSDSVLLHLEKGSSPSISGAEVLTTSSREKFCSKYNLGGKQLVDSTSILVIDDFIPKAGRGQGLPRAACLLQEICKLGYRPTVVALNESTSLKLENFSDLPEQVTPIWDFPRSGLRKFLAEFGRNFSRVLVSRPANMEELCKHRSLLAAGTRIIYDAEAIFASRSILKKQVETGIRFSAEEIGNIISVETKLAGQADLVVAVSASEAAKLARVSQHHFGATKVHVLAHGIALREDTPNFQMRDGFLMVGPTLEEDSPNSDGVLWFLDEIFPKISALMNEDSPHFTLAGQSEIPAIRARSSSTIEITGFISDLKETYDKSSVFVAPIRYSAGIPLKVIEATAHGLPSVVTPLLAEQLDWRDGQECMVGESANDFAVKCKVLHSKPETWERIRTNAMSRVAEEYSIELFRARVRSLFNQLESLCLSV